MPTIKIFGDRPPAPGPRKVATPPATKMATPPIQLNRYFRNTKAPDATAFSMLNEHANQAMLYRTKEVFGAGQVLGIPAGINVSSFGVGARARWRGAFHTSPYTHALLCRVVLFCQSSGYNFDSYARLRIYSDTAEVTQVASQEFHYGPSPTGATAAGWQHLRIMDKFVEGLSADTDYYFKIEDVDYGRIQSISIVDLQSPSENFAGYLPQNFTSETPLLDTYRENLVAPIKPMWNRGGAKVLTWSVDDGTAPRTIASATPTNVIDATSTTVSAATPGFTLDMRGKNREGQSSVPVEMVAFGSCTVGTNGVVVVKDSAGVVQAAISTAWTSTPSWQRASCILPATEDKYDVQFYTAAGTFSLYAVSVYEYEA